jgi:hypothetical protein
MANIEDDLSKFDKIRLNQPDMDKDNQSMEKQQPYQIYPMALQIAVPEDAERSDTYVIRVSQRNLEGIFSDSDFTVCFQNTMP